MKKKIRNGLLSLLVVAALGTAVAGGVFTGTKTVTSSAENYKPSDVFTSISSAAVSADSDVATFTSFKFPNGGSIEFRRDLAIKWFEKAESVVSAKYLNFTFGFKDTNFEEIKFTFEVASASAEKETKATNTIVFTNGTEGVKVKVNDGTEKAVDTNADVTIALKEELVPEVGKYSVMMTNGGAEEQIGTFQNVGGAFADYSAGSLTPMSITAKLPEGSEATERTAILFKELNGQSFTLDESGNIATDALPVLCVNEEVTTFTLGADYSLDYEAVDVLTKSVTKAVKYYQYNPVDTDAEYKTLSSSVIFMDKTYKVGDNYTSVYKEEGMEYVSVKYTLTDTNNTGDNAPVYDLVWYATSTVKPTVTATTENAAVSDIEYIKVAKNENGPTYSSTYDYTAYQALVTEKASETTAGSGSYFYLPSVKGMFEDDDTGYTGLKFNIYYKSTSSSSSSSSTNLSYSALKFSVSKAESYEFKIVAIDKSANVATVVSGGEVVEVKSDNVWDLDEIPSFKFKLENTGISVDDSDSGNKSTTGTIGKTKTVTDCTVKGSTDYNSEYALYFFDLAKFKSKFPTAELDDALLASISYSELTDTVAPSADKTEYYFNKYVTLLADKVSGVDAEDLKKEENGIFREIKVQNTAYSDKLYPDNKFEYTGNMTFTAAEEGIYLLLGVYSDTEVYGKSAAGYRVVKVSSTVDEIKGESEWLKNNMVSVVLFSIAGVMFVLIIILALVKPSDEKLEDLDKEKVNKKGKKS